MPPRVLQALPIVLLVTLATVAAAGPAGQRSPHPAGGSASRGERLEGSWQGALAVSSIELRLVIDVVRNDDGSLTGTLDSPDQGARGIPLSAVVLDGDRVRIGVAAIGGELDGRLTPNGRIEGLWKQGGNELPLTLERSARPPEPPGRPQEPSSRVPYRVEEVTFDSRAPGVRLAGTLTLPAGDGPFPAVALISGSGPQDRDESIMDHRPFAVIADRLTRSGVAVLRFDDRGVGGSNGDFAKSTLEDFADDAEGAWRSLGARPEVDPGRVGLLGHSEGATVAARVAARRPAVAFLVLVAPPAVPGAEILPGQVERMARAAGLGEPGVAAAVALQLRIQDLVLAELSEGERARRLDALLAEGIPEPQREGASQALELQRSQLLGPWFRSFLRHDPADDLSRVGQPVLALWGDKDLQVPPEQNRPPLEAALIAAGNQRVTARTLPGLNHLLQTADTGLPTEYARIEETIAPAALELIAEWLTRTAAANPGKP